MTTEELKNYYTDLLIIQYKRMPNARAVVALLAGEVIAGQIMLQVRDAFNLDTAVGKQLDFLGAIVGVTRYIHGLAIKDYFGMPEDGDTVDDFFGFVLQTAPDSAWYFLTYPDLNAPLGTLTDGDFRRLIKYTIKLNALNTTLADIDALLWEFFPGVITPTDNGDNTITYTFSASSDPVVESLSFTENLPKPAGVGIIIA